MPEEKRQHLAIWAISLTTLSAVLFTLSISAIAQPLSYHQFADNRPLFLLPNGWNVITNLGFLVVGVLGTIRIKQSRLTIPVELFPAYRILFIAIALIGFGSSYYHLNPSNSGLFWDRLPMAIAFMALFSIVIGEFVSIQTGQRLLSPLVTLGIISVVYWHLTETFGQGDLRLYGLVQFLPLLLVPMILLGFKSTFSHGYCYWGLLLCYLLAKLCEHYDHQIFALTGIVSGHSLKHLVAAAGLYLLYLSYLWRKPISHDSH